jgi:hypothetical protein
MRPARRGVQRSAWLALCLLLTVFSFGAGAQTRNLPEDAQRGVLRHVQGLEVLVDDKPMRLAPGATVRNRDNLIVVPASLPAEGTLVEYVVDGEGAIFRAWVLTDEEAARQRRKP